MFPRKMPVLQYAMSLPGRPLFQRTSQRSPLCDHHRCLGLAVRCLAEYLNGPCPHGAL